MMLTKASQLAVVVSDSSRTDRLSVARIRLVILVNNWHGLIVFPLHEFVSSFWSRFDIRLAHLDSCLHVEDAGHPRNVEHSGSRFNS